MFALPVMCSLRRIAVAFGVTFLVALSPVLGFDLAAGQSICFGTPAKGRIEGAVRMPTSGPNFRTYCWPCVVALRTYGHDKAVAATVAAYGDLAASHPGVTFVYGEIGLPWGGRFPPHKTHRNGLSFDFMVPIREGEDSKPLQHAVLSTTAMNRFGYDEDFDSKGIQVEMTSDDKRIVRKINFDAIAAHLLALDRQARTLGGQISRVILDPRLQDDLFRAKGGNQVRRRLTFNRRAAWVRHDDHYHVDFLFRCAR